MELLGGADSVVGCDVFGATVSLAENAETNREKQNDQTGRQNLTLRRTLRHP